MLFLMVWVFTTHFSNNRDFTVAMTRLANPIRFGIGPRPIDPSMRPPLMFEGRKLVTAPALFNIAEVLATPPVGNDPQTPLQQLCQLKGLPPKGGDRTLQNILHGLVLGSPGYDECDLSGFLETELGVNTYNVAPDAVSNLVSHIKLEAIQRRIIAPPNHPKGL
jgi:hypothetical protein